MIEEQIINCNRQNSQETRLAQDGPNEYMGIYYEEPNEDQI